VAQKKECVLIYMRIFICTVKVAHIPIRSGVPGNSEEKDPTRETTPLPVVSCLLPRQTNAAASPLVV